MTNKDTTHIEKMAAALKKINPNSPLLARMRAKYQELKKEAEKPKKK